jgi:RimJ/RimL family protein N-acetyltransferase
VAVDNPRAHAFYRRNGFALDGAKRDFAMLGTDVPVVRMVR